MPRLTITLPQKTHQYVSSIAIRDKVSLSKTINRLLQVGMHYMHSEERATPGKEYYQKAVIQSYALYETLSRNFAHMRSQAE